MVNLRETRIDDLRRHEIGKHFLGPHIVKPVHGNQVTKPHMRRLMRNEAGPSQQLGLAGRLIKKQTVSSILDSTDVLHAAVLETRDQGKIEFLVGVIDAGIVFQPAQRSAVQLKHCVHIACYFFCITLSMQHAHLTTIHTASYALKLARHKRK